VSALLENFIEHLEFVKNYSFNTIKNYRQDISGFLEFLKTKRVKIRNVDKDIIRTYLHYLVVERKLANKSISRSISANRTFWAFLKRQKDVSDNPWEKISIPKISRKVLDIPTYEQIDILLRSILAVDPLSIRDRAIFETLYATGIRVSELTSLTIGDLDMFNQELLVYGKGSKERIVIIGKVAANWIDKYLKNVRGNLIKKGVPTKAMFLNKQGGRLTPRSIERKLVMYVNKSALHKKITPHTLRHAFASHLLQGGADLRTVQELLGHVSLSTTQVYTHLNKDQIKDTFKRYHPRN